MKPIDSEITTSQREALSKTGTPLGERGLETQSSSKQAAPRSVEEWRAARLRMILQIEALNGQQTARRGAELIAILEVASAKIDRFGWNSIDKHIKDSLCADWCDVLSKYTLAEVRAGVRSLFNATEGKLRSINEHQVEAEIRKEHQSQLAGLPKTVAPEPEKSEPRITPDQAAKIMLEAGFRPKRFGGRHKN